MTPLIPEHWTAVYGPSDWFALGFPPQWHAEQSESQLQLTPASGDCLLVIRTGWSERAVTDAVDELLDLGAVFPSVRNIREAAPLKLDYSNRHLRAEVLLQRREPWYRRLFQRERWLPCSFWGIQHGPVVLLVTLLQLGPHDPERDSVAQMILQSLQISDHPADPPDIFASRVADLAQAKFPLLEIKRSGEFQLELGESRINLFNFYRRYVRAPEEFERIMLPALTTVVQVQGWGEEQTRPPLSEVRDRILPMLYPAATWQEQFESFAGTPWLADLAVLYVVDESSAYWYLQQDLVDEWGLDSDRLHALALENLERYFVEHPMEMAVVEGEEQTMMLIPGRPDSYNGSRVLSPVFQRRLQELLSRPCVVGIPGRDFLVAVNVEMQEMVSHVRRQVQSDYAAMDHPLSDQLFLVSPDGVSVLVEAEA